MFFFGICILKKTSRSVCFHSLAFFIPGISKKPAKNLPVKKCFFCQTGPWVSFSFRIQWGGRWYNDRLTNYCWWTKSCTSWYGKYPIIYRVSYIPGGAGFLPSTVSTGANQYGSTPSPGRILQFLCIYVCILYIYSIGSMYGIFPYIYHKINHQCSAWIYHTCHGSYIYWSMNGWFLRVT